MSLLAPHLQTRCWSLRFCRPDFGWCQRGHCAPMLGCSVQDEPENNRINVYWAAGVEDTSAATTSLGRASKRVCSVGQPKSVCDIKHLQTHQLIYLHALQQRPQRPDAASSMPQTTSSRVDSSLRRQEFSSRRSMAGTLKCVW